MKSNQAKCPVPTFLDNFDLPEPISSSKNFIKIPDLNSVNSSFINHLIIVRIKF